MELKIEPSHTCKLKCIHCSSVDIGRHDDMTIEHFEKVVSDAKSYGFTSVVISGGEPLLWPPLLEASTLAAKLGFELALYTSGNPRMDKPILEKLKRSGVERLLFGIHGGLSTTHDEVTQRRGSFNNTYQSIYAAVENGFKVELHYVPLRYSYTQIGLIFDMFMKVGVSRISLLRLVPHGRATHLETALTATENAKLAGRLAPVVMIHEKVIRIGAPFNVLCLGPAAPCQPGVGKATIGPDLRVFPCDAFKHITPEHLGLTSEHPNLSKQGLRWCLEESEYFKKVRSMAAEEPGITCVSCRLFQFCGSGCLGQKILKGLKRQDPDPGCIRKNNHTDCK